MGTADIQKALETLKSPLVNNTLNRVAPGLTETLESAGQELLNDTKLTPNTPTILNNQNVPNNNLGTLQERLSKL